EKIGPDDRTVGPNHAHHFGSGLAANIGIQYRGEHHALKYDVERVTGTRQLRGVAGANISGRQSLGGKFSSRFSQLDTRDVLLRKSQALEHAQPVPVA